MSVVYTGALLEEHARFVADVSAISTLLGVLSGLPPRQVLDDDEARSGTSEGEGDS